MKLTNDRAWIVYYATTDTGYNIMNQNVIILAETQIDAVEKLKAFIAENSSHQVHVKYAKVVGEYLSPVIPFGSHLNPGGINPQDIHTVDGYSYTMTENSTFA